jgi:phosphotransferase system enzyme I (PtsI)
MSEGSRHEPSDESGERALVGIAGSPGLAVGTAIVLDRRAGVVRRYVSNHHVDDEMDRFMRAIARAADGLRAAAERERERMSRAESPILAAYALMVEDETLRADVERRVRIDKMCVEWALASVIDEMTDQLASAEDSYLAERSHDVQFIGQIVLRALAGDAEPFSVPQSREPRVLCAHDLSPAETATLSRHSVLAIVTEVGTRTSHTAILARALEIPAVVGVSGLLSRVGDGDLLVVDGLRGRVTLAPSETAVADARRRVERAREGAGGRELGDRPLVTRCGVPVELKANIELPSEAVIALDRGARGIGLYRTEFLYVNRSELPSEEEQFATYRQVLEAVAPLPVTLRTFDIGGDKFVSAFQVPKDMNPALGLRAVRLGLARRDLFMTQLRAIVRASAFGSLRVMVPMIASLSELRAVRQLLEQAIREVDEKGQPRAKEIPLGTMVEVPSAAIIADRLAPETAFMSIGTNDLVQYALAVDRSSPELAHLASFFDPSILRLIEGVVAAGMAHGRGVFVCGAMASDPLAVVLLVGMGLRELSLEASSFPAVRAAISRITVEEAEEAARDVRACTTAIEVEALLEQRFAARLSSEPPPG